MLPVLNRFGLSLYSRGYAISSQQIGSALQALKRQDCPNGRSLSTSIPRSNDTNRSTSLPPRNHNVNTPRAAKQTLSSLTASNSSKGRSNIEGKFRQGSNYAPKNMNSENIYAQRTRRSPPLLGPSRAMAERSDELFKLNLRPGHVSLHDDSYKNPVLLSSYVSVMGKIKPRKSSGLTRRSQREVAKAIRRARSMGLMPIMSKMPYKAWN